MTIVQLTERIPVPPARVYDYVTRPARWKEWHPASLGTPGHGDESLSAGATFEENIRSAGFTRRLHWTVVDSVPPRVWEAHARMADGSAVRLRYELDAEAGGTRFRRTLSYHIRPRLLRLANDLLLWRKVRAESEKALRNLVRRLAAQAGAPA